MLRKRVIGEKERVKRFLCSTKCFRCECPEGYTGKDCGASIDFCSNNPCLNGGSCRNTNVGYVCECSKAYAGELCEIKRNTTYTLKFTRFDTTSYVKLRGFQKNLTEVVAFDF